MTSVAVLSNLRRTLTDVMEDELYHVPPSSFNNVNNNNNNTQQSQPAQQQHQQQPQQPQAQTQPQQYNNNSNNYSWSNPSLNNTSKSSPLFSHAKLHLKNNSAMNSEEMLTIPDNETAGSLSKVPSHDMYYDVPENLPEDFNTLAPPQLNIFNEYADPNLTTTNNILNPHLHQSHIEPSSLTLETDPNSNCGTNVPTKLLKFNDDLTLDYFTNDDDSKFVIFPNVMSPDMIPEEIEDEELSEDEDEGDFSYLDDINPNQLHLNSMNHQIQIPMVREQFVDNEEENDATADLESNIDKMSLVSTQEYSSDSSVIEEDEEEDEPVPSFLDLKNSTPQPQSQHQQRLSIPKTKKQRQSSISNISTSSITKDHQHQCHLINPSNGKMCLKQFSRPYDLIRHQETIHAERKKIFRCVVCNELEGGLSKKTFSRGDALSRHVRVKHGLGGDDAINAIQYAKDHVEYL